MGEVNTEYKSLNLYILKVEEKLGDVISNKDIEADDGRMLNPPEHSTNNAVKLGLIDNCNNNNSHTVEVMSTENRELQLTKRISDSTELLPLPSVADTKQLILSALLIRKPTPSTSVIADERTQEREVTPLVIITDHPSNGVHASVETKDEQIGTDHNDYRCTNSKIVCAQENEESFVLENKRENCAINVNNSNENKDYTTSKTAKSENCNCHDNEHQIDYSESMLQQKQAHVKMRDNLCSKEKLERLSHLNLDLSRHFEKSHESFYDDKSPEMQVVVNSLTPVLSRRRTNKKRAIINEEKENSILESNEISIKNLKNLKVTNDSLTMSPEMSATWHGPVNFVHAHRPKMGIGIVMSESTPLFANQENRHLKKSSSFHSNGTTTMPKNFSKTILDAMHKKYCAHQYSRKIDPGPKSTIVHFHKEEQFVATHSIRRPPQSLQLSTDGDTSSTSGNSSPATQRFVIPSSVTPAISPASEKKINIGHNERHQAEIEAVEACKWLRATVFPQYAQLYEDGQFPIDISVVEKDHDFLDRDSMQSLFRRLNILNKCALMKIYAHPKKGVEESDDDDLCVLSDRWEFQKDCRRWSRKDLDPNIGRETVKSCSSHDSLLTDQDSSSQAGDSPVLDAKMPHEGHNLHNMLEHQNSSPDPGTNTFIVSPSLKRAASERIKSAKNLLKKMESLKSRKGRKFNNNKNIVEISGPVVADSDGMQAKIQHLNCVDISPSSEQAPQLPTMEKNNKCTDQTFSDNSMINSSFNSTSADDQSLKACSIDSQLNSTAFSEYHTAMSQLSQTIDSTKIPGNHLASRKNQHDTNFVEIFFLPEDHKPGKFPIKLQNGYIDTGERSGINYRTGSFSAGSNSFRDMVDSDDTISAISNSSFRRQLSLDNSYSGNRYSVYDNIIDSVDDSEDNVSQTTLDTSSPSEELTRAQEELDMILHNLFENINGLNKTINGDDEVDLKSQTATDEKMLRLEEFRPADDNHASSDTCTSPSSAHSLRIDTTGGDLHDSLMHTDTSSSTDPTSPASPISPIEANSVIDNSMDGDNDMISSSSSSVEPSDQDIPNEEFSPDDSLENAIKRERRDSGVGSSLTRAPSDKKRKKIRWPSFQKCHRPSLTSRDLQVNSLTVRQLQVLRKMSLLRLTGFMEKFIPTNRTTGWNWTVPRFMKRSKTPDYSVRNIFGIPLALILRRTGQPLPQCILYAMRYLHHNAEDAVGIFRKSGVRSRIQKLRQDLEERPDSSDFSDHQAYDVADMFKQFFRELPECLLTVKLSETFISIFTYVQQNMRLEAMQAAVVLLPDENREVLQSLLLFLSDISQQASIHQMTASNLAVCFGPSLFNIGGLRTNSNTPSPKPKHRKNLGVPDAKELMEQKAALECLTYMIIESKKLFMIPSSIYSKLHVSYDNNEPTPLVNLLKSNVNVKSDVRSFGEDTIQMVLKETHEKNRGWISFCSNNGVDICSKKPHDSHPLKEWKATVDIEAPPVEVLNRLLHERHVWDEDMLSWAQVEQISNNSDVFQYISNSMAPQPTRHYCVLRYWRTDLAKGACAIVSSSVNHPDIANTNGVRALELASHYLIEPCGTGKCRLTHIARTDTKGRVPEWYNKAYGFIIANYIERIRDSFHQTLLDSPETNV